MSDAEENFQKGKEGQRMGTGNSWLLVNVAGFLSLVQVVKFIEEPWLRRWRREDGKNFSYRVNSKFNEALSMGASDAIFNIWILEC